METRHSLTVAELRGLLDTLGPDDVLTVNGVRNFAVFRDGYQIGYLELLEGHCGVHLDGDTD